MLLSCDKLDGLSGNLVENLKKIMLKFHFYLVPLESRNLVEFSVG